MCRAGSDFINGVSLDDDDVNTAKVSDAEKHEDMLMFDWTVYRVPESWIVTRARPCGARKSMEYALMGP